ncbi:hypothetical protein D3OALGA1CA_1911 [Olavius algarvensis associated proteobacterium Delta 3]|nr:hypothetical protein D3OALGA1CA_1911 [Olavius algarvensis associated proteobacterium Delta 3]CAB5118210.1 hypothetical protein D3OALGB2SA_2803 [Olavius algarvensis associated proteobacterium Delta 3]
MRTGLRDRVTPAADAFDRWTAPFPPYPLDIFFRRIFNLFFNVPIEFRCNVNVWADRDIRMHSRIPNFS